MGAVPCYHWNAAAFPKKNPFITEVFAGYWIFTENFPLPNVPFLSLSVSNEPKQLII